MERKSFKGWLYLLPAVVFLGFFLVYPLIDVFIYSFEEGYNSASQTYYGTRLYNYSYVLRDPYFLQALRNTFILVAITVPVSTLLALGISVALSSVEKLKTRICENWGLGVNVRDDTTPLPENSYGWSGAYGTHFWVDEENQITALMLKNHRALTDDFWGKSINEFEKSVMNSFEL